MADFARPWFSLIAHKNKVPKIAKYSIPLMRTIIDSVRFAKKKAKNTKVNKWSLFSTLSKNRNPSATA